MIAPFPTLLKGLLQGLTERLPPPGAKIAGKKIRGFTAPMARGLTEGGRRQGFSEGLPLGVRGGQGGEDRGQSRATEHLRRFAAGLIGGPAGGRYASRTQRRAKGIAAVAAGQILRFKG